MFSMLGPYTIYFKVKLNRKLEKKIQADDLWLHRSILSKNEFWRDISKGHESQKSIFSGFSRKA